MGKLQCLLQPPAHNPRESNAHIDSQLRVKHHQDHPSACVEFKLLPIPHPNNVQYSALYLVRCKTKIRVNSTRRIILAWQCSAVHCASRTGGHSKRPDGPQDVAFFMHW